MIIILCMIILWFVYQEFFGTRDPDYDMYKNAFKSKEFEHGK